MPNKPVIEMRSGSVRITAWESEEKKVNAHRPVVQFTVERRYCDQKGDWHSSPRFYKRDLLDLALLCHAVYEKFSVKERNPSAPALGAKS